MIRVSQNEINNFILKFVVINTVITSMLCYQIFY